MGVGRRKVSEPAVHPAQVPIVATIARNAHAEAVVRFGSLRGAFVDVGPLVAHVDFLHAAHVHGGRAQEVVVEFNAVAPVFDEHASVAGGRSVRGQFPRAVVERVLNEPLRVREIPVFKSLRQRQIHLTGGHDVHGAFNRSRRLV